MPLASFKIFQVADAVYAKGMLHLMNAADRNFV